MVTPLINASMILSLMRFIYQKHTDGDNTLYQSQGIAYDLVGGLTQFLFVTVGHSLKLVLDKYNLSGRHQYCHTLQNYPKDTGHFF